MKTLDEFFYSQENKISEEIYTDGALINPNFYPLKYIICNGSILFVDLPNYSSFCEKNQENFNEIIQYLNRFFAWIEAERKFEGIVDKYIGDEILLIFPEDIYKDHLQSALSAAKLIIDNDFHNYSPKIGIASGKFALCEIGTIRKNNVTVVGHTVNLAARFVQNAMGNSIKVATTEMQLVKSIFNNENDWNIEKTQESFKNIYNVDIINLYWKVIRIVYDKDDFT